MIVLTEFNTYSPTPSAGPNMAINLQQQQQPQYSPNFTHQPQLPQQNYQMPMGVPQQNFIQQQSYGTLQYPQQQFIPPQYQYQPQQNITQQPTDAQPLDSSDSVKKKSFKETVSDLMQKKWARNAAIGASVLGGLGLTYGGYKAGMFDHMMTGAIAGNADNQTPVDPQLPNTTNVENKPPVVHDVQPDPKAVPEGPPPQQHIPLRQSQPSYNNPVYVDHSHSPRQSIMIPDNGRMPYNYQYHGDRPFDRITGQRIMRIPGYSF